MNAVTDSTFFQRLTSYAEQAVQSRYALISSIVLAILALSLIALSAGANAGIATLHGASTVLTYSPYTIALPLAITALLSGAIAHILMPYVPANIKKEIPTVISAEIPIVLPIAVNAPCPGKCVSVEKAIGERVEAGAVICTIECMKMYLSITAKCAGTITHIHFQPGESIKKDEPLFSIQPVLDSDS